MSRRDELGHDAGRTYLDDLLTAAWCNHHLRLNICLMMNIETPF